VLAVALWNDRAIRALPRDIRDAICDALGHRDAALRSMRWLGSVIVPVAGLWVDMAVTVTPAVAVAQTR